MSHRELPDGTRVYDKGMRYKPVPAEERKYGVRKPDDPAAVRFHGRWFRPLELLPDGVRRMPDTRPDADTLAHPAWCMCEVCQRPAARVLWQRARRRS